MDSKSCDLMRFKVLCCLIQNTREGSWPRFDCEDIIKKYSISCIDSFSNESKGKN